jgi:hypothetical protein
MKTLRRQDIWDSLGPLAVDSEEGLQEIGNHIADSKVNGLREFEGKRCDASEGYDPNDADDKEKYGFG